MTRKQLGLLAAIISATIYGLMPLFAKIIYSSGCTPMSLVFYRGFIPLPILFMLMQRNHKTKVSSLILLQIFLLTAIGVCSTQVLLFSSYNHVSTGLATTLHFSYPLFTVLGCFLLYKENLSKMKIICVLMSTVGIILFYSPGGENTLHGILLAFTSGLTFSFYIIYLDKTGLKNMHPFQLGFYMALFSSFIMFFISISTGTFEFSFEPKIWVLITIFALMLSLGSNVLFQLGVRYIGPQSTAILSTFEPITSIVVGIMVFNEIITIKIAIGICLILCSVLLITIYEK